MSTLKELVTTLQAVGKPTEVHKTADGTQLLILPYGGRILGVFAPGSEENFLWTNSALNSSGSTRAYYASDDWQNSGGDRTWLAPELDFFFPKFPDIDIVGYWQPRGLDPAIIRGLLRPGKGSFYRSLMDPLKRANKSHSSCNDDVTISCSYCSRGSLRGSYSTTCAL